MSKKSTVQTAAPTTPVKPKLPLDKTNLLLILVGVVIVIVGFLLMAGGGSEDVAHFNASEIFSFRRITLAPIVVIFGFAFVIYAIMRRPRS
jgi:preprotein translocase subunit SecG